MLCRGGAGGYQHLPLRAAKEVVDGGWKCKAGSPPAPIPRDLPAHGAAFCLRLYSTETPSTTHSPVILSGHGLSLFILAHSGGFCCQFIPTHAIGVSGWQGLYQAEHFLRQSLYRRKMQRA